MTADQYRQQLVALLPKGAAWVRQNTTRLAKLLDAMAQELARLDRRADELVRESDPRSTSEMLPDWERVCGLPDPCVGELGTVQQRRNAVIARLTGTGGASPQFFIDLSASLGFDVTITEFRPFRAGMSAAGDALTNGPWVFTWRVNAPADTITPFRAGGGAAGEPLRAWGNDRLECVLSRVKPAHTHLLFGYAPGPLVINTTAVVL